MCVGEAQWVMKEMVMDKHAVAIERDGSIVEHLLYYVYHELVLRE